MTAYRAEKEVSTGRMGLVPKRLLISLRLVGSSNRYDARVLRIFWNLLILSALFSVMLVLHQRPTDAA